MTTKVKTTVTFTFDFISDSESVAICSLRSWVSEYTDERVQLVVDSDSKEYTYLNTEPTVGRTFKFKTPAEFIEKYANTEGYDASVRAMLGYARDAGVTATVETIEVEEGKTDK